MRIEQICRIFLYCGLFWSSSLNFNAGGNKSLVLVQMFHHIVTILVLHILFYLSVHILVSFQIHLLVHHFDRVLLCFSRSNVFFLRLLEGSSLHGYTFGSCFSSGYVCTFIFPQVQVIILQYVTNGVCYYFSQEFPSCSLWRCHRMSYFFIASVIPVTTIMTDYQSTDPFPPTHAPYNFIMI